MTTSDHDNNPLISVVTIFLNARLYIREAIESVLAQTYPHWELLLIDDGSTDGSTEIALEYSKTYPLKIHYLHHPDRQNRGMSASRNLGWRSGRGGLVAFLDADDVWLPNKFERQQSLLQQHPDAGMVCGPTEFWFSWTEQDLDQKKPDSIREIGVVEGLHQPPALLRLLPLDQVKTPATCSVLLRRRVLEDVDGFENSFRGMFEDQAFFAKVFLKTPILLTGDILDRYRQHPASCCAKAQSNGEYIPQGRSRTHYEFLLWLEDYLNRQDVSDEAVWKSVGTALYPYRHPLLSRLQRLGKDPLGTSKRVLRRKLKEILSSIA